MGQTKEQLEEAAKQAYLRATGDEEPAPGFFSLSQWTTIMGQPRTTVQSAMAAMVRDKRATVQEYRIKGKAKRFYKVAA